MLYLLVTKCQHDNTDLLCVVETDTPKAASQWARTVSMFKVSCVDEYYTADEASKTTHKAGQTAQSELFTDTLGSNVQDDTSAVVHIVHVC